MGIVEIIIIIVILFALFGGGYCYSRRGDWGAGPAGGLGLLVTILLIVLLLKLTGIIVF